MERIAIILRIGQIASILLTTLGCANIIASTAIGLAGRPGGKINEVSIEAIIHGTIGIMIFYVLEETAQKIGLI